MVEIRKIEKQWIDNFKKSPLVKTLQGKYNSSWASQFYYGREEEDDFPKECPENFRRLYSDSNEIEIEELAEQFSEFLNFVGISISKQQLSSHFDTSASNKDAALKKANYLFKMLAHQTDEFDFNNPYRDNNGDLLYFLRIATGGLLGQLSIFDTLDLPELYNKYINIPEGYENDKSAIELFHRIENTNKSLFVTGKAGTGKSTFVHYFAQKTKKKVLITSFTGIAAINVGGVTIHSFFKFPLKPLLPNDHEIPVFKDYYQARKIIKEIDVIIIDEVSMLRADLLEALDYSLRKNGGNENQVFGGKQLLLVGDIFQLPPVTDTEDEVENFLFSQVYDSEYFFSSPSFQKLNPEYVELKKVHRQKDDFGFVELLNKIRLCETDDNVINSLNQRFKPDFVPNINDFSITLTVNNYLANSINSTRLAELPFTKYDFEATIEGEFRKDKYPTLKTLSLKKNTQVLFVKNDSKTNGRRWVNGTIAKIDFISHDIIEVRLQNGEVHKIEKETWENRKYEYDREKQKIVSKVVGTFQQFPLKLAWAITIHKSQGLTFENVIIDLGSGAFVNGQVYTALSRCKTLQGIVLKRKLRKEDIIADPRLLKFYNEKLK